MTARRAEGGSRFLYESFDAAAARIEANERVAEERWAGLEYRLGLIEATLERLEKRIWVGVYGVAAFLLAQMAETVIQAAIGEAMTDYGAPERKFHRPDKGLLVSDGHVVEGYASLFGKTDQGGDIVQKGAYSASLRRLSDRGGRVKMLWQHDPGQPIGVWDEVREDATGLWVKGRILTEVERGREVAALVQAGAIDGLSIGYRTVKAERDGKGKRLLSELELWEVSLVTFPMLPEARVAAKASASDDDWRDMAAVFEDARRSLAGR